MKKQFNVNGTKFTVNVDVETESYYDTIQEDHKKILYLLGEVSKIGSKLDYEFTTRNRKVLRWQEEVERTNGDLVWDMPGQVRDNMQALELTTRQKNQILDTIDTTMWWFNALKSEINRL